jgi:hypothetical protein
LKPFCFRNAGRARPIRLEADGDPKSIHVSPLVAVG